jgi:hypothetical protein
LLCSLATATLDIHRPSVIVIIVLINTISINTVLPSPAAPNYLTLFTFPETE